MAILFGPASFTLVRGTRWDDDVTLTDKKTGLPVNLVGIVGITMRVRKTIDSTIAAQLSMAAGTIVLVNPAAGVIGIRCNSAFTLTFPANGNRKAKYVYDAVIERTAGEYEPGISGKVTVVPTVTRAQGIT